MENEDRAARNCAYDDYLYTFVESDLVKMLRDSVHQLEADIKKDAEGDRWYETFVAGRVYMLARELLRRSEKAWNENVNQKDLFEPNTRGDRS